MKDGKKTPQGKVTRCALLTDAGLLDSPEPLRPAGVGFDDLLDAYAVCRTAERIAADQGKRIPDTPALDARGLRMEMWM